MDGISIYQVLRFPNQKNYYALLTAKGLMVADFEKNIYRLISNERISHDTYDNTSHHTISSCGRYLLQNARNPMRTLIFKFPENFDICTQTPLLIKELMNAKELDVNLTTFGDSYIDFEGYMCKIEQLERDADDKHNRSLKAAKDTIVLHEDSVTG